MTVPRSYGDPCGIARALDRVGERWALLVVRELLFGPRRFTDLRAGLPTASPNVLSQRLDQLEAAGVIQRRALPPPAGATVYELTPWGADLEPVVLSLARWGSRAVPVPRGDLSTSALLFAMKTTFNAEAAGALRARIALTVNDEPFCAEVARKGLTITRGECSAPDAAITTDPRSLRAVVFGGKDAKQMHRDKKLTLGGDGSVAVAFLGSFRVPAPVSG